jgi:hypothetical protein
MAAVDVHSDEVISEDALENADVIRNGGLGQVRLSLSYIGSIAGVVIGLHMRAQSRRKTAIMRGRAGILTPF